MVVGIGVGGAWGSFVSRRASAPATYSTFASGKQFAGFGGVHEVRRGEDEAVAEAGDPIHGRDGIAVACPPQRAWKGWTSLTRPAVTCGASISSSTATATRGSWQSLETLPLPGLRRGFFLAASVSG